MNCSVEYKKFFKFIRNVIVYLKSNMKIVLSILKMSAINYYLVTEIGEGKNPNAVFLQFANTVDITLLGVRPDQTTIKLMWIKDRIQQVKFGNRGRNLEIVPFALLNL